MRVTSVTNYANLPQESDSEKRDNFALKKLEAYGFHPARCAEALSKSKDGDVGIAFESLMADCFNLKFDSSSGESDNHKDEEKMAIESIYPETFSELIPNKLWELKLDLPHVLKAAEDNDINAKNPKNKKPKTRAELEKDPGVCQFFLRGHCKFGRRCYKKHVTPDKETEVDDRHLRDLANDKHFILEIRFPDRCDYPNDPPLASLKTPMSSFPKAALLKITTRLMTEAKELAADTMPSVFALVSLLENVSEMKTVIRSKSDEAFSFAPGLVPDNVQDHSQEQQEPMDKLMSSLGIAETPDSRTQPGSARPYSTRNLKADNDRILKRHKSKTDDAKMQEVRRGLPAWNEKENILAKLVKSQVVVISGMTGCGKSTQVPQYILDDGLDQGEVRNIICTQPRRISAIGVAERVAQERNEKVGNLVGYQIRLESKTSASTRLLFCTTGILLRRLESDPELNSVTHVVVDEVHERSEESDFLLMIIRDLLPRRPKLKIILMSATLNANLFSSYFGKIPVVDIPGRTFPVKQFFLEEIISLTKFTMEEHGPYAKNRSNDNNNRNMAMKEFEEKKKRINKMGKGVFLDDYDAEVLLDAVEGANFKEPHERTPNEKLSVKQIHWRYSGVDEHTKRVLSIMDFDKINYDLIEATLLHILQGGAYPEGGSVLVFLPGMQEIVTLIDQVSKNSVINKCKLLPLHSSLSSEEQSQIFAKTKQRKIVVSTNLAETSITIDDCVFVIEVGRMKEKAFDPQKNMESLDTVWVSRANALQRKGRAGRVMPGYCFHLYTHFRFDCHLRQDPVPEILRVPLEQMLLRIKIMPLFHDKQRVQDVLRDLIEPPASESVKSALERLRGVGALDEQNNLTPMGYHLASLPVDVRIGKLMLLGAIFNCLDSTLTMAACLSYKSPFVSPFGKREEARKKRLQFSIWNSDQLTDLQAFNAWRSAQVKSWTAGYGFCQENYLSIKTLQTLVSMKHQFAELLSSIGFIMPSGLTSRRLDKAGKNGTDSILNLTSANLNSGSNNPKLLVSLLCAALYPNVVQVLSPKAKYMQTSAGAMAKPATLEELRFKTRQDGYVHLHPSSVNAHATSGFDSAYIVYHEKIKTSRVFVRECSLVPIYSMVLFGACGVDIELQRGQFVLSMDGGWIKFVTHNHTIAECLKEMRRELDAILEEKIAKPGLDLALFAKGKLVIETITKLIADE